MTGTAAQLRSDSRSDSPADSPSKIERSAAFAGELPARAVLRAVSTDEAWPGVASERLELISRGDFVPGLIARHRPAKSTKAGTKPALLLAIHDAGDDPRSPALDMAARWVGPDLAVVAIDLPLHGHRASPKLTERLVAALGRLERGSALDRNGAVLVEEFWRQAIVDLVRTLDAVLALGEFDPQRVGLLGVGLGAALGTTLLAQDPRPAAAVLIHPASAPPAREAGAHREIFALERELGPETWGPEARAFLASRLGF